MTTDIGNLIWNDSHHLRVRRWMHVAAQGDVCIIRLPDTVNARLRDEVIDLLSTENAQNDEKTRRALDLLTEAFFGSLDVKRLRTEFIDDALPENRILDESCTVDGKCSAPPRTARTDGNTITIHSTVRTPEWAQRFTFNSVNMRDASPYAVVVLHEFGHVLHFADGQRRIYDSFWQLFKQNQVTMPSPTQFLLFGEFLANEFAATFINCAQ